MHLSDSWARTLKALLKAARLTKEEIAVLDNRGNVLPMRDGLDAEVGELKDVPARDRFPLLVRKKMSQNTDARPSLAQHLAATLVQTCNDSNENHQK